MKLIIAISEISSEAKWVKEGDEFDEDQIEEWWGQAETHYPMLKRLSFPDKESFLKEKCPLICKIKGPCGHFH